MNGDDNFVRALSEFLAFHTEQSSAYFSNLINSFMKGAQGRANLDPSAQQKVMERLKSEAQSHNNVPTFLQNYLHTHLVHGGWPPQAAFLATRYLERRPDERFVTWQRRQQLVKALEREPVRGTELGFRQMLYSQGAGPVFRWRGVPCFKSSYDIAIYTMLVDELRPGTIVELGAGSGGSGLFFADLCAAMNLATEIVSIDIAAGEVTDPRIGFVQADCLAWLKEAAKAKREFRQPCLMIEDFHGDLGGFFDHIDAILRDGDYLVIEDSFPKQKRISEVVAGRSYLVDSKYTDFFGVNCTSAVNSIFVKRAGPKT